MISEQEAREAAVKLDAATELYRNLEDYDDRLSGTCRDIETQEHLLIRFARQELSRRDAERAARQQPITPEWCLANGAKFCEPYYIFEDQTRLMLRLLGHASLVFVNGQMLDWSATCVGQVEDLRKALRGGAT